MTKKELLNAPDYTHVRIDGKTWIKHGSRLHRGNYYNDKSEYIDIYSLPEKINQGDGNRRRRKWKKLESSLKSKANTSLK